MYDHQTRTDHTTTVQDFNRVEREGQNFIRIIQESIYKRINNATLNRNIGKYNLAQYRTKVYLPLQN